jgi:hypothetical protein
MAGLSEAESGRTGGCKRRPIQALVARDKRLALIATPRKALTIDFKNAKTYKHATYLENKTALIYCGPFEAHFVIKPRFFGSERKSG